MLVISAFFGFGSYLTFPYYRGGWATSGHMHRALLISLSALALCLLATSLLYRRIGNSNGDKTASLKLVPAIATSALLIYAAALVALAHPIYIDGSVGPYWNQCFLENIDHNITYTQLTLASFALVGITQILWSKTLKQPPDAARNAAISISRLLQTLSGTGFLIATAMLILNPYFEQNYFSLPILLSLIFLLTQALSSPILLKSTPAERGTTETTMV
jgi:hypothetical protein